MQKGSVSKHLSEWYSTEVHTFTPDSIEEENQKHLVIFWGGGTSTEGMLSEVYGFAKETKLTIHAFNYPFVNNSEGTIYTHNDLVTCSKAVLNSLPIHMDKSYSTVTAMVSCRINLSVISS